MTAPPTVARRGRVRTSLAGLALVACSGCGDTGSSSPVELPRPDLSRVDQVIREELEAHRATFDAAVAAGDAGAEEYGRIAMLYHANEQYPPAEAGYRNALQLEPDAFAWTYYLARLLETVGERAEAIATYERALTLDPTHVPSLLQLADIDLEDNDLAAATARFARAIELDPACVPAWIGAGNVALANRDYPGAVDRFQRALELSPDSSAVHYPLGLAYRGLGDTERARHFLERRGSVIASVDDPLFRELQRLQSGWRTHQTRGTGLAEAGRYEDALQAFRTAVAAAPDQPSVHVNIGSTLAHLGRLDDARQAFERAAELDGRNATALFNLGTLSARAGDDEKAIAYYRKTLAVQPDYLEAHFNLANALRRTGRFAEAIEPYQTVIAGDPANPGARLAEALTLVRLERYAEAADRLEEAHAALPEDRPIRGALARLLAAAPVDRLRDGARARRMADALFAEERSLGHVVILAMAAAESGDYATAVEWQRAAIGAAEQAGRSDFLPELRANLALYEAGRPCRRPWAMDDPALSPGRSR